MPFRNETTRYFIAYRYIFQKNTSENTERFKPGHILFCILFL